MSVLLFIDFETAWDTKSKFGLKDLSVVEYVRDQRFKAFGFSYAIGMDMNPRWVTADRFVCSLSLGNWKNMIVVGHNIKFDGFILREKFGIQPKAWIDTKGMSRAILGKTVKNHSLATLAEHFDLEAKGTMKTDGLTSLTAEQENELAEYCNHDVWLCREIYKRLAPKFPEDQYASLSQTIDMFVNPKLVLNVPLLEKTAKEEALRRETIFKEIGIDKKDFASNIKFPKLLRDRGYDVPTKESPKKKDEQGNPLRIPALALGDIGFIELMENGNEELKKLCEARIAAKSTLLETRSTKLGAIGATGRWPFDVEYSGANQTHRFSGGSGAGGNPQNFTRDSALREAVEAPKGCLLVVGDFSQIEVRLVAGLAKDPALMSIFLKGGDPYCEMASMYYGRTITKADVAERRFGKETLLGRGYAMGPGKFQKRLKIVTGQTISDEEAWQSTVWYRSRFSKVPALWEELESCIKYMVDSLFLGKNIGLPVQLGYESIWLPSGLKMLYPNLRQQLGKRNKPEWVYEVYDKGVLGTRTLYGGKVLENICQSLAGELCKDVMQKMGKYVVGQVHDEVILVVPEEEAENAADKLYQVMTASPAWLPDIKLEAEVGIGKNWREAK